MLKKPNILVVGSFVMDLIVTTPRFPGAGETVLGSAYRTAPGGKGANQAVQAARSGSRVTMVGRVGRDGYGRELTSAARSSGVDVCHVAADPCRSSAVGNIQIETKADGSTQNRIIVVSGANMAITPEDVAFLKDGIKDYDIVVLQLEIPMAINELVAGYAKAAGVPVMLNSAPSASLSDELLRGLDYISPNEYECADLTGVPIRADGNVVNEDGLRAAAQVLLDKGVKNVVVTLGGNGSCIVNHHEFIRRPCVPGVKVADPTAAGDSFVGSFCTGLCAGLSHSQALDLATHTAAITVSRMGAMPSLPTLDLVQESLAAHGCGGLDPSALEALK